MIEDFLKYKLSVHQLYQTRDILSKPRYFSELLSQFQNLDDNKYPDFWFYKKKHNLITRDETSLEEYEIQRDALFSQFKEEIMTSKLTQDIYTNNYLNIPIVKFTDTIFEKFKKLKQDFISNQFDRYKEVDTFILFLKNQLNKIKHKKIECDIITKLYTDDKNEYLITKYIYSDNVSNNCFIDWEGFKDNLNLELSKILDFNKREVTNYTKDELTNKTEETINDLITNGDYFNQWDELFKEKNDYDNFIDLFVSYSNSKELNVNLKVNCKNGTKTKLSKLLRELYAKIGLNDILKHDKVYLTFIQSINHYKENNIDKIYELLNK